MTIIEESNYYEDEINFENGFPKTSTKNDTSMIHGYRMKSIKYLVQKYNEYISYVSKHNIYSILITFKNNFY